MVRAGSSSTCWPAISAKLSVSDMRSSSRGPIGPRQCASSTAVSIRLIPTMAWRQLYDNMRSIPISHTITYRRFFGYLVRASSHEIRTNIYWIPEVEYLADGLMRPALARWAGSLPATGSTLAQWHSCPEHVPLLATLRPGDRFHTALVPCGCGACCGPGRCTTVSAASGVGGPAPISADRRRCGRLGATVPASH